MKTALLCALLSIVSVTSSHITEHKDLNLDKEWDNFKQTYKRNYYDEKIESNRKAIFAENLERIRLHNLRYLRGLSTYDVAVNKYSDMTLNEIRSFRSGYMPMESNNFDSDIFISTLKAEDLPEEVDWRKVGLVTPAKNQRKCSSCYIFSVIGAIEGQVAKKTKKLISLSEQNVLDCVIVGGCQRGGEISTYKRIINSSGIDTEESYPYEGVDNRNCRFKKENVAAKMRGYTRLGKRGNETELQVAVATVGPIVVSMDDSDPLFHDMRGDGVYEWKLCTPNYTLHSVLVVGYGKQNGQDYWLVKNSWGTEWGDEGFFKIARNKKNMCGIATSPSFPIV